MKVHYLIWPTSLNVFTASKGSYNYILFNIVADSFVSFTLLFVLVIVMFRTSNKQIFNLVSCVVLVATCCKLFSLRPICFQYCFAVGCIQIDQGPVVQNRLLKNKCICNIVI